MSVQRSPTHKMNTETDFGKAQSTSNPELNDIDKNITVRPLKRKQDCELTSFMSKMENMFLSWQYEQNKKLEAFLASMAEKQTELTTSIEFISNQYEDMKNAVNKLLHEKNEQIKYIKTLEHKIETLEKYVRSSSLEIRNVPMQSSETLWDLTKMVHNLGNALQTPSQESEIKNVFRIKRNNKMDQIIVEFTSDILKYKILTASKHLNKSPGNQKLSTTILGISGPEKPIYISENLTPRAKRLFYLAREFKKNYNYHYVWTSNGNIYIRKSQEEQAIRVNSEEDLKILIPK